MKKEKGKKEKVLFDDAHSHTISNFLQLVKHSLLNIRLISWFTKKKEEKKRKEKKKSATNPVKNPATVNPNPSMTSPHTSKIVRIYIVAFVCEFECAANECASCRATRSIMDTISNTWSSKHVSLTNPLLSSREEDISERKKERTKNRKKAGGEGEKKKKKKRERRFCYCRVPDYK